MGGAQSSEIKAGSAVTGKWCKRVEMPKGVVGEQMPGGMRPGSSFKSFTPTLLQELLEKKDAKALYAEFEAEVSKDCGGEFFSGWNSPKIMEKVTKFQPRFAEKRLRVAYHMVMWYQYVYNQYGGSTTKFFKYYMTYSDLDYNVPPSALGDVYDPNKTYDEKDITVVTGSTVAASLKDSKAVDPRGKWELEIDSQVPEKTLSFGEMVITGTDKAYKSKGSCKYPVLFVPWSSKWECDFELTSPNVYSFKMSSGSGEAAFTSPTTLTLTMATQWGTMQMTYNKSVNGSDLM